MDLRKVMKELLDLAALPKGDGLVGFTDEQLKAARDTAREIASYSKDTRNVDDLRSAVEAFEAISTELTDRVEAAAAVEKDIEALSSRITVETEQEEEKEEDDEGEDAGEEKEPEPVAVVEAVKEPAPVAASTTPETKVETPAPVKVEAPAVIVPDPTVSPSAAPPDMPVTLTAAGDVKGVSAGQTMDPSLVAGAMLAKSAAVSISPSNGRWPVGQMDWIEGYKQQDRYLDEENPSSLNMRKINAVIASAQAETREYLDRIIWEQNPSELAALTAAGGLCAPVNVRYEIFTVGTTARPLRDSLTRFGASRGGIRFNAPPTLQGSIANSDAVNIFTETEDQNSTGYPKGCLTVGCGADTVVDVGARTLCMIVGNYQRMFFGENFTAWWGLGRVQHARVAEDAIWDRLDTLSTNVSAGELLGATPDTLAQIERAAAQYKDRHRVDPSTPLRLRAPAFLRNILRTDLARRMPGDNTLAVSDGEIARYFAVRGIAVTWVLDGQIAGGTSGYTQAAGALNPWPTSVDVNLSIDGTFLFLDGGSLDFGTEIRDFTMIRTNDSAAFMETFEEVAFVGPEALHITLNICPSGEAAALQDSGALCTAGS